MAPQQRSPFLLEIGIPADYESWYAFEISRVEISVKEANEINSYLYADFEVTVASAGYSTDTAEYGAYWIEGTVQNTGAQTASKLVVTAVYYNSDGNVVAVGHTKYLEPHDVKPSGTVTFKVGAYDTIRYEDNKNNIITSYTLLVDVSSPLMTGKAPTVTTPITGSSTETQKPPNQTTPNRNYTYIIIIIVAVSFAVIAALLISRKNTPPKTETNKHIRKT
jgi:co-chaperonin GroES (HSP10)